MRLKYLYLWLLSSVCFADIPEYNSPEDVQYHSGDSGEYAARPFLMITGGPAFLSAPSSPNVYAKDINGNAPPIAPSLGNSSQIIGMAELDAGIQTLILGAVQSQWSILVGAAGTLKSQGQAIGYTYNNLTKQDILTNTNYSNTINQLRVGGRTRWSADNSYSEWEILPYITGSVAMAFNQMSPDSIFTKSTSLFNISGLSSNTQNTITYSIGAGLQKDINCNIRVGVGYEYFTWGKSSLTQHSQVDNVFSINGLSMQTAMVSVMYIPP